MTPKQRLEVKKAYRTLQPGLVICHKKTDQDKYLLYIPRYYIKRSPSSGTPRRKCHIQTNNGTFKNGYPRWLVSKRRTFPGSLAFQAFYICHSLHCGSSAWLCWNLNLLSGGIHRTRPEHNGPEDRPGRVHVHQWLSHRTDHIANKGIAVQCPGITMTFGSNNTGKPQINGWDIYINGRRIVVCPHLPANWKRLTSIGAQFGTGPSIEVRRYEVKLTKADD